MSWNKIENYENGVYKNDDFKYERLRKWLKDKKIITWTNSGAVDIPRFLKTGRNNRGLKNIKENKPPFMDHVSYFKSTNPLKVWMVYHPYFQKEHIEKDISEWAKKNNLDVQIYSSDKTWYAEGSTSTVVITTP